MFDNVKDGGVLAPMSYNYFVPISLYWKQRRLLHQRLLR